MKSSERAVAKRLSLLRKVAREEGLEFKQPHQNTYLDETINLLFIATMRRRKVGSIIRTTAGMMNDRKFPSFLRAEVKHAKRSMKAIGQQS
jgi:hypothetical protein